MTNNDTAAYPIVTLVCEDIRPTFPVLARRHDMIRHYNDIDREMMKIVSSYVDIPSEGVRTDTEFCEIGLNSLDLLSALCDAERKFKIEIPDSAINGFHCIDDIIGYIKNSL